MRFRLIDAAKKDFPVQRLCKILDVSPSGYFAWKDRPACRRQRDDMVLLAHFRLAFAVSNGTYGSPRMMPELRDNGLAIGCRRTARLMRENGLKARQKRRFRRTTESLHAFPVAPNLLDQDFAATGPNEKWPIGACQHASMRLSAKTVPIPPTSGRGRASCIWLSSLISSPGAWSGGQPAIGSTRNWPCRHCAAPLPYDARRQDAFTTRTAAANIAPSSIRRNCETAAL